MMNAAVLLRDDRIGSTDAALPPGERHLDGSLVEARCRHRPHFLTIHPSLSP
jgi:hypothetical protein